VPGAPCNVYQPHELLHGVFTAPPFYDASSVALCIAQTATPALQCEALLSIAGPYLAEGERNSNSDRSGGPHPLPGAKATMEGRGNQNSRALERLPVSKCVKQLAAQK
jgi:hypothetical protein